MYCLRLWLGGILLLAMASACMAVTHTDQWTYHGEFHNAISGADHIVGRSTIDPEKVFFEITDPREIKEIAQHIQFESPQVLSACMCSGYPVVDWYKGQKKLAVASIQHGVALRWGCIHGDPRFTHDSAAWIVTWLAKHGINGPKESFEAITLQESVEQQARPILQEFTPPGYLDALEQAEREPVASGGDIFDYFSRQHKLKDKYIRALFQDQKTMYTALFRLMGCLPMKWNARYSPEQDEAYDFLIHAPVDELDRAIQSAACSQDAAERQGAARIVFSELYMTNYGKTDIDISRWMEILAKIAYADPFPENRRLVLCRLQEHHDILVLDVLEQAISDPDQTVRQKAIQEIGIRGGPEANQILRRVADGKIKPRVAEVLPTDFTKGASAYSMEGMKAAEGFSFSDQRLAELLIKEE